MCYSIILSINNSRIVNRKEIVLGFASHPFLFTMLTLIPQPSVVLHIQTTVSDNSF